MLSDIEILAIIHFQSTWKSEFREGQDGKRKTGVFFGAGEWRHGGCCEVRQDSRQEEGQNVQPGIKR